MISFVWSSKYPFLAGAGGSENYTVGHIRELRRRGIPARILTLGHGENDGREGFPDIPFKALNSKEELSELDDTIIFVTYPLAVRTRRPSYAILHCPPSPLNRDDPLYDRDGFRGKRLITTSKFASRMWKNYLGASLTRLPVVYPFAERYFSQIERPTRREKNMTRLLFAGRLTPDKGIYTLMAALHMEILKGLDLEITVTDSGSHSEDGKLILPLLHQHPYINVVPARHTAQEMAQLMAQHDVVAMPSSDIFWKEIFGIVSVEAQHAGCRVVASRSGGLPETNVGGLLTVEPDNPKALAAGIAKAAQLGPLSEKERQQASIRFTLASSVDALLRVIDPNDELLPRTEPLRGGARLSPHLASNLSLFGHHLKQPAFLIEPEKYKLRADQKNL
jgi:D-inositol-3-phosphate glycosyltransferase